MIYYHKKQLGDSMFRIKEKILVFGIMTIICILFTSQQIINNVNSFTADPGSFEILNSYQGRNNVLKVDRSKTNWYIASFPLGQYRGKEIFIELSADVRREGSAGVLSWHVSNPNYPIISMHENAAPDQWHSMKGKKIITPAQNDFRLYLTNWQMPSNTTVYIANPVITITEGNPLTPDLSLRPLKEIYSNDFHIGNITDQDGKNMSGKYLDLLKHHFNIVTFNAAYPEQIAPSSKGGAYQFANADNILNTALINNLQVHGHVLVWHGSEFGAEYGKWMTEGTREEVIQNMNNHITTVLRHFRGRVNSWDVVNEALKRDITSAEARRDWRRCIMNLKNGGWGDNLWYEKLGADYIELAFRAARAADPNVTLYYNDDFADVNMAEVGRKMILDINDRYKKETGGNRNLIEGVGIQGHLGLGFKGNINDPNNAINNMRAILRKFTDLGIEIAITELDIPIGGWQGQGQGRDSILSERDAIAQAVIYARLLSLFREFSSHIKFVTFWGIDDSNSWLSVGNPTLFDWKLNAKPAFNAVSDPEGFLRQHGGRTRR
ncbi:MAG: endo-1,4-beta-xylanase [Treponema sp.]|jgi:endo-1,4-beta-xylanase|nr:endo-1,4-beta-xylanase [Treponema sp.]